MTPRCAWTGQRSDRAVEITVPGTDRFGRPAEPDAHTVLPEHEADLRAFADLAQRAGRPFLLAILALTVGIVAVALLGTFGVLSDAASAWGAGLGCMGMGLLMIALPFATPEAVAALGVRRSMLLARVSGVVVAGVGLAIGLWG